MIAGKLYLSDFDHDNWKLENEVRRWHGSGHCAIKLEFT